MISIEEARKVLWLKSNPRPLGELLDEGYLTQERIEWAAKWAFNYKLKEATQVLLQAMKAHTPPPEEKPKHDQKIPIDNSLPIGITLEKARSTLWPFAPYKGQQIGALVESKQLSLKDLGYAIENARDENVKQAAVALTLIRLQQVVKEPPPSAGFVQVVSGGRSYSEQRQLALTLLQGLLAGVILTAAIIWTIVSLINSTTPHPNSKPLSYFLASPSGIIALAIALAFFIFAGLLINYFANFITKSLDQQIEEHHIGQEGEDRTVQLIVQALDGNWHLFRNIQLPGRNKGDLDIVLVGPSGVWALEVKNFRGQYRNIGEKWEYRRGKTWKAASVNPSRQALNNAARLGNFLKADHLNVFVNPAVVWANEESPLTVENPSVAVWLFGRLPDELGNIWQGEKLSNPEREKIAVKLSKLCKTQKSHGY